MDLSEASDTELWMQIHHHDDMDVDEDVHNDQLTNINPPGFEVQLQDMVAARESARRIYEQRRLQALERGDVDALEALERNYGWGFAMCDLLQLLLCQPWIRFGFCSFEAVFL